MTIITQKPNEVIPALQEKLSRGITIIPYALGAYNQENSNDSDFGYYYLRNGNFGSNHERC